MKISAIRAVQAVRQVMKDAGLGRTSALNGGGLTGWTDARGSTGWSVARADGGKLRWHVVLSGKPHFRYRQWKEWSEDSGEMAFHEPQNVERIFPAIRAAFARLGLADAQVTYSGHQMHWDDDVEFDVETSVPGWLEPAPARGSTGSRPPADRPLLVEVGFRPTREDNARFGVGAGLAAYASAGRLLLTRESVEHLIGKVAETRATYLNATYMREAERQRRLATYPEMKFDGSFFDMGDGQSIEPETVENFWGDRVEAWPLPASWLAERSGFSPKVPVMIAGALRQEPDYLAYDAQFGGEAPWIEPPAAGPAP